MIVKRASLSFAMAAAFLLGVALTLAVFYGAPVVASRVVPQPTPAIPEHACTDPAATASVCLTALDRAAIAATSDQPPAESVPLASQAQPAPTPDYRYTTLPVPEGYPADQLGPPDQPAAVSGANQVLAPEASYNASLRIAGSVLRPRTSTVEWAVGGQGGCLYVSLGPTSVWFNAPVYLPQGATIKYFRMYVNDTNPDTNANAAAYLTVYDLYGDIARDPDTNVPMEWGVYSSGSTGESYWTTDELTHTVDYDSYAYVVHFRPNVIGPSVQLCGMRIYYHTPPAPIYLPLVLKSVP